MASTPIQLDSIPGAFAMRLGLPRPNWEVIAGWVDQQVAAADLDDAWAEVARLWLANLNQSLPPGYSIAESEKFLLLSRETERVARRMSNWCEGVLEALLERLDGIANDEGFGKRVVLAFAERDNYYDYIADTYPEDNEYGQSGGVFIAQGYAHIALCMPVLSTGWERALVHELTHALLAHLPMPLWLDEGVTQVMEDEVLEASYFMLDAQRVREHREFWTPETIDAFWSGDSFSFSGEGQALSYELAFVLLRNLLSDFPKKTREFVRHADFADAGDSAAREVLGVGLAVRVAQFLGSGDWQPRSNYGTDAES